MSDEIKSNTDQLLSVANWFAANARQSAGQFRPRQDRLLVRRLESEAKTPGGVIIPEQHRERPSWGEVVSVGGGRMTDAGNVVPVAIEVGARVLFGRFSGTEIKIDGAEYLILREDEILGDIAPNGTP